MIVTKIVQAIMIQVICKNNMSMHLKNLSVTHPSEPLFYPFYCTKRIFERPAVFTYYEQKSLLNMVDIHGRPGVGGGSCTNFFMV